MNFSRVVAGALALLFSTLVPAFAQRFDAEQDRYFDPPAPLPQEITGVIRASAPARPVERIERIRHVFEALRACWAPVEEADGQITLRLAFKRSGEVLGPPRVTYAAAPTFSARDSVASSVFAALERCAPMRFSQSFGAAVAGRPFTLRFVNDRNI